MKPSVWSLEAKYQWSRPRCWIPEADPGELDALASKSLLKDADEQVISRMRHTGWQRARTNGIKARDKQKFVVTAYGKHMPPSAQNMLKPNLTTNASNQIWTGDISYVATDENWLQLVSVN